MISTPTDQVRDLAAAFQAATAAGDQAAFAGLCIAEASMLVYDADGFSYRTAAHWALRPTLAGADLGEPEIRVEGDVALLVWPQAETVRTSVIAVREAGPTGEQGGWRVAHVHRSPVTPGPRPGGI